MTVKLSDLISTSGSSVTDIADNFTTDTIEAALAQLATEKIEITNLSTALADYSLTSVISATYLPLTGGTISSDLTVQGDFSVTGTTTTIDTDTVITDQMSITNAGTGPALIVNQTGAQPVVDFQDDGTSALYIEDGGFVGIGTTSPTSILHVKSAGTSTYVVDVAASDGSALFNIWETPDGEAMVHVRDASGDAKVKLCSNGASHFSGGNVGIGTTSPDATLDVDGNIRTAWTSVKTSTYTAVDGDQIPCNTTSAGFTVTLPAGSVGAEVTLVDYAKNFSTNNLTVASNGSEKIEGSTENLTLELIGTYKLHWFDATRGWVII